MSKLLVDRDDLASASGGVAGHELLELLGRGSSAAVYRASVGAGAADVAIKLMPRAGGSSLDARVLFEHEAELLGRLDHPGIVRLLQHGTSDTQAWLVTELAPGRSLAALLAERGALAPAFAAETLRQVAVALAHAHGQRILHRDIKPSNIVVDDSGGVPRAKLLDFGFAHAQGTEPQSPDASAIGTFLYMSPEQFGIVALAPDERSDLYALGIVAIELLGGRHPYAGLSLRDLIHAHAAVLPTMPAGVPPMLARILERLVRKDPADRYRTAEGVAADLETFLGRHRAGDDTPFALRTRDGRSDLLAPRFFGRASERAALAAAHGDSSRGLRLIAVAGTSGMGKTRLIGEAARGWTRSLVLWGRGRAYGQTAGYGLIAEALHGLSSQPLTPTIRAALRAGLGEMGGELLALVPALRPLLGDAIAVAPLEPEKQQARLFALLGSVLAALATPQAPLVLILDDLQWADDGSLRFVQHIAKRLAATPLLLVLSWRAEEVLPGTRIHVWLEQLRAARAVPLVTLEALDEPDVRALVASMLGGDVPGIAEAVVAQAQGHPLHAIELPHAMAESGLLRHGEQGWFIDPAKMSRLSRQTDDLLQTIVRRLDRLDESEREVLAIAAVAGRGFAGEVVRQVLQAETGAEAEPAARRTVAALAAAERAQLIVAAARPGAHVFSHDKIREALHDALPIDQRERLHERIGDALRATVDTTTGTAAGAGGSLAYALAHHYGHASSAPKAVEAALQAADLARKQYAHFEALSFLAQARRWAGRLPAAEGEALERRLAEAIADSQVATGQIEAASLAYEALLGQPISAPARAEVCRKLAMVLHVRGQSLRAEALLQEALTLLGERVPRTRFGSWWQLLRETLIQFAHSIATPRGPASTDPRWLTIDKIMTNLAHISGYFDTVRGTAVHLRHMNLMERHRVIEGVMSAYETHGATCTICSMMPRAIRYQERALALRHAQGDRWGTAQLQALMTMTFGTAARWEEAIAHGRTAVTEAEQQGDPYVLNLATLFLAFAMAKSGRWAEAVPLAERAARTAAESGHVLGHAYHLITLSDCAAAYDLPTLGRAADESLTRLRGAGTAQGKTSVLRVKAKTLLQQGQLREAETVLAEAEHLIYERKLRTFTIIDVPVDRAHTLLRLADQEADTRERARGLRRARAALRRARIYLAGLPTVRAALLRTRALERSLSGKDRAAERLWSASLHAAIALGMPPEQALTLAEWGAALRERDPQRGANLLARARSLFIELGARHELARWGLAPMPAAETPVLASPASSLADRPSASGSSESTGPTGRQAIETERLRTLVAIGRQLSATRDIDALLQAIVDSAARLLGAERSMLYLWDADRTRYECHTRFGGPEAIAAPVSSSVLDGVLRRGEGIVFADAQADPGLDTAPSVVSSGVRSILCAPLIHQDDVLGALYIDNRLMRGLFGSQDLELLQALASQAAISLHNARAHDFLEGRVRERTTEADQARQRAEADSQAKGELLLRLAEEKGASDRLRAQADEARANLGRLSEFGRRVMESLDPAVIVATIGVALPALMPADSLRILVLDDEDELQPVGEWPGSAAVVASGADERHLLELRRCADGHAVTTLSRNDDDPAWPHAVEGARSALAAPLVATQGLVGLLVAYAREPGGHSETHRAILETLALHVASAISNSRAYAQLQIAQAQLVEREKMAALGSLVAGVAHELNTPLGNALLLASTLSERVQPLPHDATSLEQARERLGELTGIVQQAAPLIERSLRSAGHLVSSFKQVAVDQTADRRRVFNLSELVDELATMMRGRLQPDQHELMLKIPPDITMDNYPGALTQVLTNLMLNALQHGLEGRTHGRISIGATHQRKSEVTIEFSDNGCGISEAHLRRVFEPFFTTRLGKGGSGLGLSISYNLVTAVLGGSIQVSSPPGGGARFLIVVPLVAPGATG